MSRRPGSFRFVHCADVHIDTPYKSRSSDLRRRLSEAGRSAWRAVCELCLEVDAQALVVAGDLYDDERLTLASERRLVHDLERLTAEGVAVFVATGNHDPSGGARARRIAWPSGCHVFRGPEPELALARDATGRPIARIAGTGHVAAGERANLARLIAPLVAPGAAPGEHAELPAIAVLHTQVHAALGAGEHAAYAPSELADFAEGGFDYWALGHVHARQRVLAEPPVWYPGNLAGRHFGECGAKGALVVDVARGQPAQVTFEPLARLRFEVLAVDLAGARGAAELSARVHRAFEAARAGRDVLPDQEWLVRVALSGASELAAELADSEARAELAESWRAELDVLALEVADAGLSRPLELALHRGEPHVLGVALELAGELAGDGALWGELCAQIFAGLPEAERAERAARLRERAAREPRRIEELVAGALLAGEAERGLDTGS